MVISVIESYRSDYIILCNILQNKLNLTVSDLLLLRYPAMLDYGVIGGGESDNDISFMCQ